jgi:hypothetical protein
MIVILPFSDSKSINKVRKTASIAMRAITKPDKIIPLHTKPQSFSPLLYKTSVVLLPYTIPASASSH